jgi:putative inorganic carbon (HCO3(-)) transporter
MRLAYLLLAIGGMFFLSFLTIGKEMNFVVLGAAMILVFLICFFSVKISLALLIFSMLLSPQIELGSTSARAITARIEDILLFTMTISWMIRMAIFKDIGFMLKTPLNRPMIAYSLIAIVSTTMGAFRGNVVPAAGFFFTMKIIEYFFLFNVVVNNVRTEKEVDTLLTLLLIVGGIISFYGMFMSATGGIVQAPFEQAGSSERNTLSGYLVLMGSVAAGVMMTTKSRLERTLLALLIGFLVVVLLFSVSRSGWISAIVSLVVLFFSAKQKNIYFLVIILLMFTLPLFLPQVVHQRIDFTFHQYSWEKQFEIFGLRLDTSTSHRIWDAINVFHSFSTHAFFGYGVTGFYFIDGQFFRTLIELGLFGLAVLIWLLFGVHRMIRKTMRAEITSPRLRGMVIGFYAGFWGLIAHAMSANTFLIVRISEPFWCLAGLTVITYSLITQAGTIQHELSPEP